MLLDWRAKAALRAPQVALDDLVLGFHKGKWPQSSKLMLQKRPFPQTRTLIACSRDIPQAVPPLTLALRPLRFDRAAPGGSSMFMFSFFYVVVMKEGTFRGCHLPLAIKHWKQAGGNR